MIKNKPQKEKDLIYKEKFEGLNNIIKKEIDVKKINLKNACEKSTKLIIDIYEYIKGNRDDKILERVKEENKSTIKIMKEQYEYNINVYNTNSKKFSNKLEQLKNMNKTLNVFFNSEPLIISNLIIGEDNFDFAIKKTSFFYPNGKPQQARGGALVEMNKEIYGEECELDANFEKEINNLKKSQFIINKNNKELNHEKYIAFKTKLIRGNFGQK